MEVLVVGAGAMGRWFADAVDARTPTFADVDPGAAKRAAAAGDGRAVAFADLSDADRFDVVCLAVPIPAVAEAVATHAPLVDEAMVDVTGVMRPAVRAMREHLPDRGRLSLHPLFAPARAPGRVAVVEDAVTPATTAVRTALEAAGNDLVSTTPAEHDRAMATVQARTHAALLAYGLAREPVPDAFHTPVSRALSELVEQVTDGTPRVYADIQTTFDGAGAVADAARQVADADADAFERLYRRAQTAGRDDRTDESVGGNDHDVPSAEES